MDRIETALSQESCRTRRESLIQQNRRHATRSSPKLSSSTLAAA
jgi:hypothetical protein